MAQNIINLDEETNNIKEAMEFVKKNLNVKNIEFTVTNENLSRTPMQYDQALERIFSMCGGVRMDGNLSLGIKNLIGFIGAIEEKISKYSEELESRIIDLTDLIERLNLACTELEKENFEQNKEISILEAKLEEYRETAHQEQINSLRNEIENLKINAGLISGENKKGHFDKYLDEEDDEDIIEKQKTDTKKSKISECHSKVLSAIDKTLIPIQKIDIQEAKNQYIELWGFICQNYDLDTDDYPKMIDNLELFSKEPDDYLNEVRDIE